MVLELIRINFPLFYLMEFFFSQTTGRDDGRAIAENYYRDSPVHLRSTTMRLHTKSLLFPSRAIVLHNVAPCLSLNPTLALTGARCWK